MGRSPMRALDGLPVEFFNSLPYAMALLALVPTARAQQAPRVLERAFGE